MSTSICSRACALACAALFSTNGAVAQGAPSERALDRPAGGWTYAGLNDQTERVQYAYPPNIIDRGGQRGRTLIEGRLSKAQRTPPARRSTVKPSVTSATNAVSGAADGPPDLPSLVVNGNILPLQTDDDGRYARPYAFGAGSNSVTLRDAGGRTITRSQFYEANKLKSQARVRVILAWDDPHAELDLHVLTPDGGHAWFGQPVLENGGGLDVDSVDGAGPEIFSITAPVLGPYHVYVNYWGRFGPGGYDFDDDGRPQPIITARIALVFDENTLSERRETYTVPMRKIGELTKVRSFLR